MKCVMELSVISRYYVTGILLYINTKPKNTPFQENKFHICLQYIVNKRQRETSFLEVVYIKAELMNIPLNHLYQLNYIIYLI